MVVLLLAGVAIAGCGEGPVSVQVDHPTSLIDSVLDVSVSGLAAGEKVTVRAATTDPWGRHGSSFATFAADGNGTVRLRDARPLNGTYRDPDAMGLFWSMNADLPLPPFAAPGSSKEDVILSVEAGARSVATRTIVRQLWNPDVKVQQETPADAGFYGEFFAPAHLNTSRAAVLVFGGSLGGLATPVTLAAALLASHGYPTLAIAYFNAPGLKAGTLHEVPLEYFAGAVTWLRAQQGVDPQHVVSFGESRGSEAAQLLAVHYPNLVHGVIALVPSNVALCSLPGCLGPAWTLGGQPIPYTRQFNNPAPTDDPAAVIAVEKIEGPIFLDCGGADQVWHSCRYADAIVARLSTAQRGYEHLLLTYLQAGHGVGNLVPYLSGADEGQSQGSANDANQRARAQAWPQLLMFLGHLPPPG